MSAFERLAPFMRDFVYRHKWRELRDVQVAACDVIFSSDDNLLLASATASGKTEAAFLPIITELYNNPSVSVGVLYVAPLKALINDQFVRIEELLKEADIPVTKWHGDASQSSKDKLTRTPKGVLQITPESLEALLMRRKQSVEAMFCDLRFIVIDEVHNFIASDRGIQLSSILERIADVTGNMPRRVGLSATLGDIHAAEKWLCTGTGRRCRSPMTGVGRRKAQIMLNHFYADEEKKDDPTDASWASYYEFLYDISKNQKCIIFSNSRGEVETNINRLKLIAESKSERDIFNAHHGSISKEGREFAEEQMRTADTPVVTGATVTLELGIDLGDLERIVQTGSPHSVSSLSQRLGRSGRQSGVSQMCFVFSEDYPKENNTINMSVNWQLIKCMALIELYRENWLEPPAIAKYPYNILLHQTLSVVYGFGDVTPALLAQKLLSLRTFEGISRDDYRILLRYMIERELLELTREGRLMPGKMGEKLTNYYDFYTVFENPVEYAVRDGETEIGTLNHPIPVGEKFVLAGRTWVVEELDNVKREIYVIFAGGHSTVNWDNKVFAELHTRVLQKMREIIASDESYGYLHVNAANRVAKIRQVLRETGCFRGRHTTDIVKISPDEYGIFPWLGGRALRALTYMLSAKGVMLNMFNSSNIMLAVVSDDLSGLRAALREIKETGADSETLPLPEMDFSVGKYGGFVPPYLSEKQFRDVSLDVAELRQEMVLTGD